MMTVKIVCIEVALFFSHKDEKTSLFSEDKLKSVGKSPLTPVLRWKSALKIFPMTTVKTVCIEVALLISHKDGKNSFFSEEKLESVRRNSLTPVFKWKSALNSIREWEDFFQHFLIYLLKRVKFFHPYDFHFFQKTNWKVLEKVLSLPFLNENQH